MKNKIVFPLSFFVFMLTDKYKIVKSCLFYTKCNDRKKDCQGVHHSFHADLFYFVSGNGGG